jgi:putative iron-dependent peroxidase
VEIVLQAWYFSFQSEAGLFFIAYTKNLDITDKMLTPMMGISGDGIHDHLLRYTRAVTGANFFAPSLTMLRSLASSKHA